MRAELLTVDLDRHVRVRLQVVEPARVGRRAALRRDDDVPFAVPRIDDRRHAGLARLRTFGGEYQDVSTHERTGCRLALVGSHVFDEVAIEVTECAHGFLQPRPGAWDSELA